MRNSLLIIFLSLGVTHAETLNILNWSDYIESEVVDAFAQRYGVEINYVTFEDIDEFEFKFFVEENSFDVVFPPIDDIQTMIDRNLLAPLDRALLPNFRNISATQLNSLAVYDPGNRYALPYLWGTTGLGINVDKVKEALGVEDVPNTWGLIFDSENAAKLSGCGISWLDSEIEMLPLSLNYIGLNPQSSSRSDFRKVEEHLSQVSPFVSSFNSEAYLEQFEQGELCAVVGYSGDIYQAIWNAEENGTNQALEYRIPAEGAFIWVDPVTITAKANKELAHAFVNELFDPENIAAITNYVWYANAVPASNSFIEDDIREDPSIYPDETTLDKLFSYPVYENSHLRTMTRRWTKIKCAAGQECLVPIEATPTD
jgi:putrescine transport system substrate-binding protein